jgi:ubiquinone/menaquinone biosynthesis C-methylase UbiE
MTEWDAETAEWYAEKYGEYATNRLGVEALELEPGMTIVDVGCGTGAALRHAAERVTEGRLIGIDPVERMLEIAREHTKGHPAEERIEFRLGSARSLPVDDACADLVLAFDSFDHWQDQRAGLAEVKRVLKPEGRLVVVKDRGSPGGRASRAAFEEAIDEVGFIIKHERDIDDEGVSFTMWICRAT